MKLSMTVGDLSMCMHVLMIACVLSVCVDACMCMRCVHYLRSFACLFVRICLGVYMRTIYNGYKIHSKEYSKYLHLNCD